MTRIFTVVCTGDILLHQQTWKQAQIDGINNLDFQKQFEDIKPIIKNSNLALCHLETPIANINEHYRGYPLFNVPPQIIKAIKQVGFHMCSTASNHSFDAGPEGIKRTLDALDREKIKHTGTYRTVEESIQSLIMDVTTHVGLVKVGIISYTYDFNYASYIDDSIKFMANKIDIVNICNSAKKIRDAGAEVVIAKLHWGTEYTSIPNSYQLNISNKLAESELINLIDGSHTHTVQPIQKIKNMWVMYSHGNFIAAQNEPMTTKSEGVITRWTFKELADKSFTISNIEIAPTFITHDYPIRIINICKHLTNTNVNNTNNTNVNKKRLLTAFSRTLKTIKSLNLSVIIMKH